MAHRFLMHPLACLGRSGPLDLPSLEVGRGSGVGRVAAAAIAPEGRVMLVTDRAPEGTSPETIVALVRSKPDLVGAVIVLAPESCGPPEPFVREGLVVFDAECPLCRASVEQLARRDRRWRLRFLPLESDFGREAASRANVDPEGPGSLIFAGAGAYSKESEAVLGILLRLGGAWRVAAWLGWLIPGAVRNRAYRWVAARRRRFLAGRTEGRG